MELQPLRKIKSQQELFDLYRQKEQRLNEELKSKYEKWYTEMKLTIIRRLRDLDQLISTSAQPQINILRLNTKYTSDDCIFILNNYISKLEMVQASLFGTATNRRFYGYDKISVNDKYEMIKLIRAEIFEYYELDFDLIIIYKPKKESINVYADISKK